MALPFEYERRWRDLVNQSAVTRGRAADPDELYKLRLAELRGFYDEQKASASRQQERELRERGLDIQEKSVANQYTLGQQAIDASKKQGWASALTTGSVLGYDAIKTYGAGIAKSIWPSIATSTAVNAPAMGSSASTAMASASAPIFYEPIAEMGAAAAGSAGTTAGTTAASTAASEAALAEGASLAGASLASGAAYLGPFAIADALMWTYNKEIKDAIVGGGRTFWDEDPKDLTDWYNGKGVNGSRWNGNPQLWDHLTKLGIQVNETESDRKSVV